MRKLILIGIFTLAACAEKPKAPESLTIQMMRQQAEQNYVSPLGHAPLATEKALTKIAFGCCNQQSGDQSLWSAIQNKNPDLFIYAGNTVHSTKIDEKPLLKQYRTLDQASGYQELRRTTPFLATWNDLDYGLRYGDRDYSQKDTARQDFLNYWSPLKEYQSSSSSPGGVGYSVLIGPPGKAVQIIVMDVRSFLSPFERGDDDRIYKTWNQEKTLLGDEQWRWFGKELLKDAAYRIVVTPLQVGANSHGERWGLFPRERQKLFDTIRSVKAKHLVILSGGKNFGSFAKVELNKHGPLFDVTAGPFNGDIGSSETDSHYLGAQVLEPNYGLIHLDWAGRKVRIEILNQKNQVKKVLNLPL